jgi:hypothetical protein
VNHDLVLIVLSGEIAGACFLEGLDVAYRDFPMHLDAMRGMIHRSVLLSLFCLVSQAETKEDRR